MYERPFVCDELILPLWGAPALVGPMLYGHSRELLRQSINISLFFKSLVVDNDNTIAYLVGFKKPDKNNNIFSNVETFEVLYKMQRQAVIMDFLGFV